MTFNVANTAMLLGATPFEDRARLRAAARDARILLLDFDHSGPARGGTVTSERIVPEIFDSAFFGTETDLLLRSNGIKTLLVANAYHGRTALDIRDGLLRGYCGIAVVPAGETEAFASMMAPLFPPRSTDRIQIETPECILSRLTLERMGQRSWMDESKSTSYLRSLEDRIRPEHTALVLIDIQNDFCRTKILADDTLQLIGSNLPNMAKLLGEARNAGCTIAHVHAEYGLPFRAPGAPRRFLVSGQDQIVGSVSAADLERRVALPEGVADEVCLTGSWGEIPLEEVAPRPGELVIRKHRYSAFMDTGLPELLRDRNIKTVVLCGVATNVCVDTSARDAGMRDFYIVVADDAVAVRDPGLPRHEAALNEIKLGFGITASTARIGEIWHRSAHPTS